MQGRPPERWIRHGTYDGDEGARSGLADSQGWGARRPGGGGMLNGNGSPIAEPSYCVAFPSCQEKAAPGSTCCESFHEETPCEA